MSYVVGGMSYRYSSSGDVHASHLVDWPAGETKEAGAEVADIEVATC